MTENHTHPHTGWTAHNYQPPTAPEPSGPPKPIGAIAAVIALVALACTEYAPVIAFALPGALAVISLGVALVGLTAGREELGIGAVAAFMAGGLAALLASDMYSQYQDIMGSFGGGY